MSCEHNSTDVCAVVLGITATHQESGMSAYKDERISVPCQNLTEFEAGAEAFIEGVIGSRGWYLELQTRIADQMKAPEPAPSDRVQPDFAAMSIGDGYTELPSKETSSDEEESVATEEETTEGETEESEEETSEETPE